MVKILIAQGGCLINSEINKELISSWPSLLRLAQECEASGMNYQEEASNEP
jgi:hypothetical protein